MWNSLVENRTEQTIGLLTAANMKSMSISSRNAMNVNVDVIVTAGLSNSRCVGAEADYFVICDQNNKDDDTSSNNNETSTAPPQGTINTIIIIDTPLTQAAQVEAYAIAIESKCSACMILESCVPRTVQSMLWELVQIVVSYCPLVVIVLNKRMKG